MRPRVFPAEDALAGGGGDAEANRFNEAAGIPRGRPDASGEGSNDPVPLQ